MNFILTWVGSLISGPFVDAWKAKLAADNDHDKLVADLAAREIEVRRQQMSNWITALPVMFLQFGAGFYLVKCWVWDAALGRGSTDAVGGYTKEALVAVVAGMVGNNFVRLMKR